MRLEPEGARNRARVGVLGSCACVASFPWAISVGCRSPGTVRTMGLWDGCLVCQARPSRAGSSFPFPAKNAAAADAWDVPTDVPCAARRPCKPHKVACLRPCPRAFGAQAVPCRGIGVALITSSGSWCLRDCFLAKDP